MKHKTKKDVTSSSSLAMFAWASVGVCLKRGEGEENSGKGAAVAEGGGGGGRRVMASGNG